MQINVININGEDTGRTIELAEDVFGIEPNEHCVYLAVKAHLANQRQGTHKSKERSEVSGSTRKLKRQKGTGTARAGDINSPVFRGGGRAFGPKPRNYEMRLNKKTKRLARKSALSDKFKNNALLVLEDFTFDAPKTKEFNNILKSLGLDDQKLLFVTNDYNKEVYLSGRNLKKANIARSQDINTYDILNAEKLVILESAVKKVEENF
ncbi:MAG: 50S ribosomal protein L4 [Saprospiraceae bacterium]|nr:50S ribosomal protein L4 [Saprospiraceae bacterium]